MTLTSEQRLVNHETSSTAASFKDNFHVLLVQDLKTVVSCICPLYY